MATIDKRIMQDGTVAYRIRVRRKGYPPQVASFTKLSGAKKWGQMIEDSIIQGRHFPTTEAKRHTVSDLLERYRNDVLPHKRASTVYNQIYHLRWWEAQIGDYLLSDITPARIFECRDQLANYWYYVSSRGFIGEQWKKSLVTVLSGSDKAMATGEAPWDVSSSPATGRDVTEALAA